VTDYIVCPECSGIGSFELDAPYRPGMYGIEEIECHECGGAGGWPEDERVPNKAALEEREWAA
jgi:hypothetical protein